jgi:hypothetical protein
MDLDMAGERISGAAQAEQALDWSGEKHPILSDVYQIVMNRTSKRMVNHEACNRPAAWSAAKSTAAHRTHVDRHD